MIELHGTHGMAKIFTDEIEDTALAQINTLLDNECAYGSTIRIMPDVHAGAACTIGTTMTIIDKVVPFLVGVDIGCGMETVIIGDVPVELQKLDKTIHTHIPAGFSVRDTEHSFIEEIDLRELCCAKQVNLKRAALSMGTLGGGNHFIELGLDEDNQRYLIIHSGSRHLGKQVADHYQNAAVKTMIHRMSTNKDSPSFTKINKALAFIEGQLLDDYLHDMKMVCQYADLNRRAMGQELVKAMKFKVQDSFTTVHNYIDVSSRILRKGAVSAAQGERILIPMNMRDGSLLCVGKGNADWNCSAPHGAGRLMSRSTARESFTLSQFQKSMAGIYSSTINKSTIDEAPFAYKNPADIVRHIAETADIVKTIKPLYNFKSAE